MRILRSGRLLGVESVLGSDCESHVLHPSLFERNHSARRMDGLTGFASIESARGSSMSKCIFRRLFELQASNQYINRPASMWQPRDSTSSVGRSRRGLGRRASTQGSWHVRSFDTLWELPLWRRNLRKRRTILWVRRKLPGYPWTSFRIHFL